MKSSDIDPLQFRTAEHPVEPLFLRRWSARAMSGEPLAQGELLRLFEAARWAPSSSNRQEWFFLYAHRDTQEFETFYSLLDEGNRSWCHRAAVLVVALSRTVSLEGRPVRSHAFDTGMAVQNLMLQATTMGLVTHPMGGFDRQRAIDELHIPEFYAVQAMLAIGHPGEIADLPERQQGRETPSGRKPVEEFIHEGVYENRE